MPITFGDLVGCTVFGLIVFFLAWYGIQTIRGKMSPELSDSPEPEESRSPRCPNCGYDLRASGNRCSECGTLYVLKKHYFRALADEWPGNPIEPRTPDEGENRVLFLSTENASEAAMLREQLIARGIHCQSDSSDLSGWIPHGSPAPQFFKLYVFENDLPAAREYHRRVRGLPQDLSDEQLAGVQLI